MGVRGASLYSPADMAPVDVTKVEARLAQLGFKGKRLPMRKTITGALGVPVAEFKGVRWQAAFILTFDK